MAKTPEKQPLDILHHKLIPIHVIISEDEKKELLDKFNITPEQLPKITHTDPVSLAIGAKPGQIVKIIRKSHTAQEAVAYRFIIESNE